MPARIQPVILCGGSGTRLWPTSRSSMPKQFVPLLGPHSTFQQTLLRLQGPLFARPIIVANRDHRCLVEKQAAAIDAAITLLLEPERRHSGPAILAACTLVARQDPEAVVLVLPSDHIVTEPRAFRRAVASALPAARAGRLVTFGIEADHPSTEYGWIRPGARVEARCHAVHTFAEKPDASRAATYLADRWLWNSGNFLMRADTLCGEYAAFDPDTAAAAAAAVEAAADEGGALALDAEGFAGTRKTSLDFAVMERTSRAAVARMRCGWSDVGNWNALWAISERDDLGNVSRGAAELFESEGCFVSSEGMVTSLVGVRDLVVVAEKDAILVADRSRCGDVRKMVEILRSKGRPQAEWHAASHRPWGSYRVLEASDGFQVKRITVAPGGRLSLQKHRHRAEHWVVVRGCARVTVDDTVADYRESEHIFIPLGAIHRLENPGNDDVELIEVQLGSYLGEDDIVRLEDAYHRA